MDKTSIGDRMKDNYEKRATTFLTRRMPVIIRLDGKAFHTFTKGFEKPFSEKLNSLMRHTAQRLCEEIQGAKLGYTQSDEISILVTDYDRLNTNAWFNYEMQKMCSISASIATGEFNKLFSFNHNIGLYPGIKLKTAFFDSRCFNIPKEEVVNYFIWRQQDWVRNSIQMLSQSLFSHKELHCKNTGEMKEMCYQKGHNWSELEPKWRNGNMCVYGNNSWGYVDDCPDFKNIRLYIENDFLEPKEV